MKITLKYALLILGLNVIGITAVQADKQYEVTVTNLTRGQIISPIFAISHNQKFRLFVRGEAASDGLAALAEDADSSVLEAALSGSPDILEFVKGSGPIMPGKTQKVIIHTKGKKKSISVAGMLVTTNDAFYALNGVRAPRGNSIKTLTVPAYDAGSEQNNEKCLYIPGPPCGNPGQDSGEKPEGFVHIHAGIHGIGDLIPARDDWRNPVASISIRRIDHHGYYDLNFSDED